MRVSESPCKGSETANHPVIFWGGEDGNVYCDSGGDTRVGQLNP